MALIEESKVDESRVEKLENLTTKEQLDLKNKKLVRKLLWLVVGSLLFAFALVPLYDVLCTLTGLNGKTQNSAALMSKAKVDNTRWVNVQFTSNVMPGLGWNFYPKQASIRLHPGQIETVLFVAKNTTNEVVIGQAVPSITPGIASANFKKIECFCFVRQSLNPGEEKEMPLRFFVSPELPKDVTDMTLSYSFFPAVNESK
ncbi:MAG: cytochrome c oxidase assembly protein [Methylotenera sp.]|uniref:cytochrome c oxidase assembly protein n=1 Tax=Methylotenera sp. TaxID=2051956 RepID=UPI0024871265|nr:cytochrome c oxidase assembly protein [Methylotenera sp.]MDI1309689.1 cytochrome c oxidase assembly protein [Methylotenera sp.]